jgi:DNA polymerase III epsilon subunit-like protein
MESPLKRILNYDLETGGFSRGTNSITEFAGVVINLEDLQIIEEFTVMLHPYFDLKNALEEPRKEAKRLFNELATPGQEGQVKNYLYGNKELTLKDLSVMVEDIEKFNLYLEKRKSRMFVWEEYLELLETEYKDIAKTYFNSAYNPQALEATHMSIELLLKDGINWKDATMQIKELISRHTIGTNKPIIAGHNIEDFDNPFITKLFADCGLDFLKLVNTFMIDTLKWVRLRWPSLGAYSLGVCCNALGLTLKEAHRALPDTVANAKLLIELLKNMRGEGVGIQTERKRKKFSMNF